MSEREQVDFRSNALFRAIPPERLSEIDLDLEIAEYETGEIIFEEGVQGACCYLIRSGRVRISKGSADGSQETLCYMGPGEFFGELALFYSAPHSARATAAAPTRAGKLYRENFERLRQLAPLELTTAIADAGIQHLREIDTSFLHHLADSDRFREIGVGLGMIAHDIRSPLATIRSAAELLIEFAEIGKADPEVVRKYAGMIHRTASNALGSTDQLLADIRGEAPRAERVSVQADELVAEVAGQIVGLLHKRKAEFTTHIEYEGSLSCYRNELVPALVNLLRNAIEALPPEGGKVDLRVEREGETVVFAVADTGCGIPEDLRGWIFERRFTYGKAGGTGLGLDQVRRVVERHGGRIDLESKVGQGTTFWLRIPPCSDVASPARH